MGINSRRKKEQEYKEIGNTYAPLICADCKAKIGEAMRGIKARDMLRPKKTAKKFGAILCPACVTRVKRGLKK